MELVLTQYRLSSFVSCLFCHYKTAKNSNEFTVLLGKALFNVTKILMDRAILNPNESISNVSSYRENFLKELKPDFGRHLAKRNDFYM